MAEDTTDGLAIIIPTSISPRYGVQMPSASFEVKKLTITIRVLDNDTTSSKGWNIEFPHANGVEYQGLQPTKQIKFESDSTQVLEEQSPSGYKQCVWRYESQAIVLKTDFILTLPLQKELHSSALLSPPDANGNAAMVITLRPTDLFGSALRPKSFTGEIVFVLDYSGSMGWTALGTNTSKVDTMRAAMSLALSGIPSTCSFNVVKFGTSAWGLWDESKMHSAEAVEDARNFTQAHHNLGGTELVRALKAAVDRLDPTKPSAQIIVITDGELNPIPVAEYLWLIRKKLQNKVRFFALGIGDNVSHQLIECMAEIGGGLGDVVNLVKKPRWEDRLNRLLRAALEPDSWTCDISLGPGFQRQSLQRISWGTCQDVSPIQERNPIQYLQSPYPTPDLHPFSYKSLYFLISSNIGVSPLEVIVTTTTSGAKTKSHKIQVTTSGSSSRLPHHLAVKACLLTLANEVRQEELDSEMARANAERLGQLYSIPGYWTSFVTVSREEYNSEDLLRFKHDLYQPITGSLNIEEHLNVYERGDGERIFNEEESALTPREGAIRRRGFAGRGGWSTVTSRLLVNGDINARSLPEKTTQSSFSESFRRKLDRHELEPVIIAPSTGTTTDHDCIDWEDAVTDQMPNGTFRLLSPVRDRLNRHFCDGASSKIQAILFCLPNAHGLSGDILHDCEDTFMMIQYFRTHMANKEDTWCLMMSRAESALLTTLGLSDDEEEKLDPFFEMLQLSTMHQHLLGFQHSRGMDGVETRVDDSGSSLKCPACDKVFGVVVGISRFFCPFEDDDDENNLGTSLEWDNWIEYWHHQVESGHVVCPTI